MKIVFVVNERPQYDKAFDLSRVIIVDTIENNYQERTIR